MKDLTPYLLATSFQKCEAFGKFYTSFERHAITDRQGNDSYATDVSYQGYP